MDSELKKQYKIDTNAKYSDLVKTIMSLSTASLLLPVFMARNFIAINPSQSLTEVFKYPIYIAWFSFSISILSGIFFQYLSAKWVRLAWGKEAGIFWNKGTKESTVERLMEFSLWGSIAMFCIGLVFTILFFASYK